MEGLLSTGPNSSSLYNMCPFFAHTKCVEGLHDSGSDSNSDSGSDCVVFYHSVFCRESVARVCVPSCPVQECKEGYVTVPRKGQGGAGRQQGGAGRGARVEGNFPFRTFWLLSTSQIYCLSAELPWII